MLVFLGDTHGYFRALHAVQQKYPEATVVQVGDLGFWPQLRNDYYKRQKDLRPFYFIDGNHEHHPHLQEVVSRVEMDDDGTYEVWPKAHYVPRGHALVLDGLRLGFCGGADSIDKNMRTPGYDWFLEEVVVESDTAPLWDKQVDVLVVHTPPEMIVDNYFDPRNKLRYGVSLSWRPFSALRIEQLWNQLKRPRTFCGHMHSSRDAYGVRVLDINEEYVLTDEEKASILKEREARRSDSDRRAEPNHKETK